MVTFYAVVSLLSAMTIFMIGTAVLFSNPKNKANILFMLLSWNVAYWGLIEFLFRQSPDISIARFWIQFKLPWALVISLLLHTILEFVEYKKLLAKKSTYFFIYAPAIIIILLDFFTNGLKATITKNIYGWDYTLEPTFLYYFSMSWVIIVGIVSIWFIIRLYLTTQKTEKKQLAKYFLMALLVGVLTLFISEILLPHLRIVFPKITLLMFVLISGVIGYKIWRHQLFTLTSVSAAESIINTISDALFLVGMDKKIKIVNPTALKLLGYESNQLIGQQIDIIFSSDDNENNSLFKKGSGFRGLIKTVIKGDVEAELCAKNNKKIPVSLSSSLIRDIDNDLLGIVCIARDITERKKNQNLLQQSKHRYKILVENSPLGILSIDKYGNILNTNYELRALLGFETPTDAKKVNVLSYSPLVKSGVSEDISECLKNDSKIVVEHPYTTRDDKQIFLRFHLVSICEPENNIVGVQAIVEDITSAKKADDALKKARDNLEIRVQERTAELSLEIAEKQKAQKELAKEKEQLSVTLASIADAVVTTDKKGIVALINPIAEEITGYSKTDAIGKHISEILPLYRTTHGKEAFDAVELVASNNCVIKFDAPFALKTNNNSEKLLSISGAPIHSENNDEAIGVVLVFSDVTQKHQLSEELFRVRKLESIGALAGGIAHDFNNILTGIVTNLFVAKMQMDTQSEAYELIIEAEHLLLKAGTLTKQLLTFSKNNEFNKTTISIKNLIEESIGFFLSGSNVDYELNIADDLWDVEVDKGHIDQAMQSIIKNADEAMPNGGTIKVSIENIVLEENDPLPLQEGNYVKISINDQREPIRDSDLSKIFDPYSSNENTTSGLGLASAYTIIKNHGGHISISSSKENGTTIKTYLPGIITENTEDENLESKESEATDHSQKIKILLMDDEAIIRSSSSRLLKNMGYEIEVTSSGEETLEIYSQAMNNGSPYDVVILDLTIPGGMGAKDTVSKLLEIDPDVKAIVSSGYSSSPVLSNYKDYGFCGVITKPYDVKNIQKTMHSVIK